VDEGDSVQINLMSYMRLISRILDTERILAYVVTLIVVAAVISDVRDIVITSDYKAISTNATKFHLL
jgi:hypothetical protein